jgi:hypothetical protein
MKNYAKIHDTVLNFLLKLKPKLVEVYEDDVDYFEDDSINYDINEIIIQYFDGYCYDYKRNPKLFHSATCVTSEPLIEGLCLVGKQIDAYGSILTKDGLLLNNEDMPIIEDNYNSKGYCHIYSFATISETGVVRFSQVVYNFFYKKILIQEDKYYQLPFVPNLSEDFGGKRATYRFDNILSLRTNTNVYTKVDSSLHQPNSESKSLSYPRLLLPI